MATFNCSMSAGGASDFGMAVYEASVGGWQIGGGDDGAASLSCSLPDDYSLYENGVISGTFYAASSVRSSWSGEVLLQVNGVTRGGSYAISGSDFSGSGNSVTFSISTDNFLGPWDVDEFEPGDTVKLVFYNAEDQFVNSSGNCLYLKSGSFGSDATKEIKLYFSANGGSGVPATQTLEANSSGLASFTIPSTTPTRNNYTFLGWSTSSSASSASYSPGDTITLSEDDTLYAVWQKNPTYTLTYDAKGGTSGPSSESKTVSPGSSAIFTVSDTVPTYEGYTFLGWSTSSAALTVEYVAGDEIDTTSNITLYAVWKENATHVITFDANGGEGEPDDMSCVSDSNGVATVTLPTSEPTRSGFIFIGWSEDDEATTATYTPGGSITLYGDVTLYAVWKICVYLYTHMDSSEWDECADTFALYQNGALVYEFTKGDANVYYAEEIDVGIYDLFINDVDSGKNIIVSSSATSVTMDISYYTITYYAPDADSGSVPTDDTVYISGTAITVSDNSGNLDKSNSLFIGWNTASDGSGTQYNVGDTINITSTLELYAMWADCYTIYDGESLRPCIAKIFNGRTWRSAKLNPVIEETSE